MFAEGRTRGVPMLVVLILGLVFVSASATPFLSVVSTSFVQAASSQTAPGLRSFSLVRPHGRELWISGSAGTMRIDEVPISRCFSAVAWSPKASLVAFETFDCEGHSPLTTRHVWVVRRDGTGRKEVLLPQPLTPFSTRIDSWIFPATLRITAEFPSSRAPVAFLYSYAANSISAEAK